ncbi:MAG: hypothetical protein P4K78_00725 [Terracidiphilus sp.]|nr:hypothetical protein [Terracidiphilus sp.]
MNVFAKSSEGLETGSDPGAMAGSVDLIDCSILVNSPGAADGGSAEAAGEDAGAGIAAGASAGSVALKDWIIRVKSPGPAGVCADGAGAGNGAAGAGLAATGTCEAGDNVAVGPSAIAVGVCGCFKSAASRSSSGEARTAGVVVNIFVALEGTSPADGFPPGEPGSSNGGRSSLMDDDPA